MRWLTTSLSTIYRITCVISASNVDCHVLTNHCGSWSPQPPPKSFLCPLRVIPSFYLCIHQLTDIALQQCNIWFMLSHLQTPNADCHIHSHSDLRIHPDSNLCIHPLLLPFPWAFPVTIRIPSFPQHNYSAACRQSTAALSVCLQMLIVEILFYENFSIFEEDWRKLSVLRMTY